MPDTTWAVNRYPPGSSQRQDQSPVLMPSALSTLQRWFAPARLLDPYLTHSRRAVSASLTTPALNRRSMRWFEATPCRAAPEGLPPSPAQLLASAEPDLHRLLLPAPRRTILWACSASRSHVVCIASSASASCSRKERTVAETSLPYRCTISCQAAGSRRRLAAADRRRSEKRLSSSSRAPDEPSRSR